MNYIKCKSHPSPEDLEIWKKIFKETKNDPDFSMVKSYSDNDVKCPFCSQDEPQPTRKDPNCKCGEPLWICLKPGQHIHPCPVHPDYVIYGSGVIC